MNPYFEIVIATLFFGLNGIFAKLMNLPATSVAFFRLFIPALFLGIWLFIKRKDFLKKGTKLIYLASTVNAIRMFLFYWGLNLTLVGSGIAILYTWPLFVAIISPFVLKEKLGKKWQYLISAFIGVLLIYYQKISFTQEQILGLSLILLSGFLYATTVIIYKKESEKFSKQELAFYQNIIGGLVFIPFLFFNKAPNLIQISWGVALGVSVGVIGFVLFFSALKKLKANITSAMAYLEVVFAIGFSALILSEPITLNLILGAGLIIVSAYMISRKKKD